METYAASCAVPVSFYFGAPILKKGKIVYHNLFRITLLVAALFMILAACGVQAPTPAAITEQPTATEAVSTATETAPTNTPHSSPTTSAIKVPASPLVGEWQRVNSCASFVQVFKDAELMDLAPEWLVGGGYFTSLDQIDSTDLCKGAVEVLHSHFFTANGGFGSHDEKGRQVDDGRYQMVDDNTISFLPAGDVTVHFNVEGETLMFEVVVPEPCEGSCREATAWALSAFYPGPFQRVP
jgi:hypothetical protein